MQQISLKDAISEYKQKIEKCKKELEEYENLVSRLERDFSEGKEKAPTESFPRRRSIVEVAREILLETGKQMHGTRELYPLLIERGVKVKQRGLQAILSKAKGIRRVDGVPNTWEAIKDV